MSESWQHIQLFGMGGGGGGGGGEGGNVIDIKKKSYTSSNLYARASLASTLVAFIFS